MPASFSSSKPVLKFFKFLAFRAPTLGEILNRRFFYCLYVNTLMFLLFLWLTTQGGGEYEFLSISPTYILRHLIFNSILFFSLFYLLAFIRFGKFLEKILCVLYFLIGIVDLFLSLTFQTQLNSVFFTIFLSTNFSEAREFLEFYTSLNVLFCLLAFILSSFLFFLPKRIYRSFFMIRAPFALPPILNRSLAFALLLSGSFIAGYKIYRIANTTLLTPFLTDKNSALRWYFTIKDSLIAQNSFIREYQNIAKEMNARIISESIPKEREIPNIVLIIGESTQRGLMSVYGYPLPSTPNLEEMRKRGDLVVFDDVISPASGTSASLQKVLTFSNYENSAIAWFKQENIIDILRLAGYKTHWLSNQEIISIYGSSPALIAQRSHQTLFSSKSDSFTEAKLSDGILLSMLDGILSHKSDAKHLESSPLNFYAIHLMGAHPVYYQRYPRSFLRFLPQDLVKNNVDSLPNARKLTDSELTTKAQYLNAIAYNDYIVSEIFKRFKDQNAIVFYLSDHGQEVYDIKDYAGHSKTRFGVEIPFIVYMSQRFKQSYPKIAKRIEAAQHKPLMSDDFIHGLLDIAGIKAKDLEDSRSVFSPHFNSSRARITDGRDYDKELK